MKKCNVTTYLFWKFPHFTNIHIIVSSNLQMGCTFPIQQVSWKYFKATFQTLQNLAYIFQYLLSQITLNGNFWCSKLLFTKNLVDAKWLLRTTTSHLTCFNIFQFMFPCLIYKKPKLLKSNEKIIKFNATQEFEPKESAFSN